MAVHETGHALVAVYSESADPVSKMIILPAGQALSVTEQLPLVGRHLYGEDYLYDMLAVELGGRGGELVMLDQGSSGASSDLARDPALGFGLAFRFASNGPFTGVKSPKLDKLINAGVVELNPKRRLQIYERAYKLVSDQAYIAMLFTIPTFNISAKSVSGPGLTDNKPEILWQQVSMS